MQHHLFKPLTAFSLITLLCLGPVGLAWTKTPPNLATNLPASPSQATAAKVAPSPSTPWLDAALSEALAPPKPSLPGGAKALSLQDWVNHVVATEPAIKAAAAKEAETQARQKSVKGQRVLFLFKYFNAQYLEGSAENDLLADKAQVEAVARQVDWQATEQWIALKKALFTLWLAYEDLDAARQTALANAQRFQAGEILHGELLKSQAQLLEASHHYQVKMVQLQTGTNAAAQRMGWLTEANNAPTMAIPTLPNESLDTLYQPEPAFTLPNPSDLPARLTDAELALPMVLAHRADALALAYRVKALNQLVKAASLDFNKPQLAVLEATYQQMLQQQAQLHQTIETALIQAQGVQREMTQQYESAWQQWQLAQQLVSETRLLASTGFGSQNELRAAERLSNQAKVQAMQHYLDWLQADLALRHCAGLRTATSQLPGLPVD